MNRAPEQHGKVHLLPVPCCQWWLLSLPGEGAAVPAADQWRMRQTPRPQLSESNVHGLYCPRVVSAGVGLHPSPLLHTEMSRSFHKHPGQAVPWFLPSSDFYKLLASDEIQKSIPYFRNTRQTRPSPGGWELENDTLSQSSGLYPNPDRKQTNTCPFSPTSFLSKWLSVLYLVL